MPFCWFCHEVAHLLILVELQPQVFHSDLVTCLIMLATTDKADTEIFKEMQE